MGRQALLAKRLGTREEKTYSEGVKTTSYSLRKEREGRSLSETFS